MKLRFEPIFVCLQRAFYGTGHKTKANKRARASGREHLEMGGFSLHILEKETESQEGELSYSRLPL